MFIVLNMPRLVLGLNEVNDEKYSRVCSCKLWFSIAMDEIVADSRFFTFLLWKNVSSMIITTTKVRKIPPRSENIKSSHASHMIVVDSH